MINTEIFYGEVYRKIRKDLQEKTGIEAILPETTLESLGMDSLERVKYLFDLESEYDVDLDQLIYCRQTKTGATKTTVLHVSEEVSRKAYKNQMFRKKGILVNTRT